MSPSRRKAAMVTAGVVAAVGVGAFVHHLLGARFESSVVPIRSFEECIRTTQLEMQAAGYSGDGARKECLAEDHLSIWFKVTVRNVGHRGDYLNTCDLRTFYRAGHATITATARTRSWNSP